MSKNKILFCISGSYIGGAEMTNIETLKLLKRNNSNLHCIINGWNDGELKSILEHEKISYTEIKVGAFYIRKIWWTIDTLIHFFPNIFKFFQTYKKLKPDVVYFTGKWYYYVFARWLKNVKIIYREHNYSGATKRNKAFYNHLNNTADTVIVDSDFIKNNLKRLNVNRPNILVAPSLVNDQSDYESDCNYGKKVHVAIAGQVVSNKGHDTLVKALNILSEQTLKKIHLFIIGGTYEPYATQIKDYINKSPNFCDVTWTGKLNGEKNFYKTHRINLVIVPSRIEAFGRVALEPAFSAIPVIASRTGGLCEIITHNENGFLFETENVEELARYIEQYLNNRELMRLHGITAKEKAIANFSYEVLSKKTLAAFKES
jgi:glycosyltransferase involved in cell wall biosynthesis